MPPDPESAEPLSSGEIRLARIAFWVVTAVGLAVALLTYADYGATWDEGVQADYGELALDYFQSGGEDTSCNEYKDLKYYGPLVELIPAWFHQGAEGARRYEIRHLFLGILSVLSLGGVWIYGRALRGTSVAILGVLAVATLPRLYGHTFNNSKDASFALAVLWFMAALAWLFGTREVRWSRALAVGVAMGLGLCMRPGGFPLFVLFGGSATLTWLLSRQGEAYRMPFWKAALGLLPKLALVFVVAWGIMVAPWPWAHEDVLRHPIEAIRIAAAFPTTVPVLHGGETISSATLPWDYLFRYVLIATPLTVLGLALLGLCLGLADQFSSWRSRRARVMTLTQVWLFAPLLLFVVMRPNIHGGMRHFLFILPALGLLAANGAAGLLTLLRRPRTRRFGWAVAAVVLLLPAKDLVRLHPYQVAYYNELVGGVGGASEDYWTDYYLSSYAEAIEWVNDRAAETPDRTVTAWIHARAHLMTWIEDYAGPNVELIPTGSLESWPASISADYYIASARFGSGARYAGAPIVHTVGRDGAAFTVVRAPAPPESE